MKNIPVSIIMSVYNANSEHLREAIESILKQTFYNFEFLIVDDASEKNIDELVASFKDPRIIYLKNKKNLGLTKSLNKAIEISKGKYIARIDSDDIAYPDRIQKQFDYLENHPEVGVLGSQAKLIGDKIRKFKVYTEHEDIKASLLVKSQMIHPAVMISGELLRKNLYNEDFRTGQDYELWSRLIWTTKFQNLDLSLLGYRVHKNQVTQKNRVSQDDNASKVRKKLILDMYPTLSPNMMHLYLKSTSRMILDVKELENLADLSQQIIEENSRNTKYNIESLSKILSENLDDNIFRTSRSTGKKIRKKIDLGEYHKNNIFTAKKRFAKFYFFYDKIRTI